MSSALHTKTEPSASLCSILPVNYIIGE
uniref:Uncharacterized protein n=1 Tax=Anguilla anguilla TaxID=7936 RepID=A0A0E9Q7L3_ANGAN